MPVCLAYTRAPDSVPRGAFPRTGLVSCAGGRGGRDGAFVSSPCSRDLRRVQIFLFLISFEVSLLLGAPGIAIIAGVTFKLFSKRQKISCRRFGKDF